MNSAENLQASGSPTLGNQERTGDMNTILFIDNGHRDRRRERIGVLKDAGFKVHPARSFEQSLSRVGSGTYDLVIANTDAAMDSAQQFIQEVKRNYPRQKLLVLRGSTTEIPGDFEFSTSEPRALLERVQSLLGRSQGEDHKLAA